MLTIISGFLRPIDNIMLSLVAKPFTICAPTFIELMKAFLLNKISMDVEKFFLLLKEIGGYLSGSCVLQVLYGEDWSSDSGSDIDIIISTPKGSIVSNKSLTLYTFIKSPSSLFLRGTFDNDHLMTTNLGNAGYFRRLDKEEPQFTGAPGIFNRYGFLPAAPTKYFHKSN